MPERALWWAAARTLFIADTHFGKAAAFRNAGLPVPEGVTAADTHRLESLVRRTAAERLVILGDFFHAPAGRVPVMEGCLHAWRASCSSLDVLLVRGNHDRGSGDPPAEWNIRTVEPGGRLGPFILTHTPDEAAAFTGAATLCGHVHPAVRLEDPRRGDGARLACFLFGPNTAILPAFGRFTGFGTIRPRRSDRVFVIADDQVIDVSPAPRPTEPAPADAR